MLLGGWGWGGGNASNFRLRLECQRESVPAVEFLRMFFSHGVEAVSDGGVLSTGWEFRSFQAKLAKTSSRATFLETHNTDGEVVVDDFVGHGVALGLALVRDDLHTPAVHLHQRAPLDVLQNPSQILAVVASRRERPA